MSRRHDIDALAHRLAADAIGGFVELPAPLDVEALALTAAAAGARVVDIGGPQSKSALLAAIANGLDLPDWFGHNWDALEETLARPEPPLAGPLLVIWTAPEELERHDPPAGQVFRAILSAAAVERRQRGHGPLVIAIPRPAAPGRVHHVAVVVRDMDRALAFYRDRLRLPVELVLPIESDGVTIAFLPVGESKIELVMPTDPSTGVARFLENRGEGFHHVCLEVSDIQAELDRLASEGVELIDTVARPGAEGPVAFIHPRSCNGVLVELIEAPGGPAWTHLDLSTRAQ